MTEALQTRTEHSRSVDDAERYRAIQTLTDVGLLMPLDAVDSYHGRLRDPDQEADWSVDPSFTNGGNDSGNYNVNGRPTLYTAELQEAEDFARSRGIQTIRARYMALFQDDVRQYSSEDRQAWLDRLNQEVKSRWETFAPEYQAAHPFEPLQLATLDTQHHIATEARRLELLSSDEEKRARRKQAVEGYEAEVHEIISPDKDATVFDLDFDPKNLGDADMERYQEAVEALTLPLTEGSPVSFEEKDELGGFIKTVNDNYQWLYKEEDVPSIAQEAGISHELARQMCGSLNARRIILMNPGYLVHAMIGSRDGIITEPIKTGDVSYEVPLNLEYAERFFRQAHIVGVRQPINSATLGKEIVSISFFDLERINTEEHIRSERRETATKLGAIANRLSIPEITPNASLLIRVLHDAHAKPRQLVEAMKEIKGYREILEADAGNWEGYTLEEHVETVLRNFDENFADTLPVELLIPMRLALLAHDLGKPMAVARDEKHKEKDYNQIQAADFFAKIGLSDKTVDFLDSILGEGVELAHQIEIRGAGQSASQDL